MNVVGYTSNNENTLGGSERPPCIGLTPDALPEVQKSVLAKNLQTGVSTKNALSVTPFQTIRKKTEEASHWYVLRVTYGREKKAYDYLISNNVEAFYPTLLTVKVIDGQRKLVEESRLPNLFFAYGTEAEIKSFVYDNVNLPYLRFYYRHFHKGARIIKEPLIVPDSQIEGLKIICASGRQDILFISSDVQQFREGQQVRVIDGVFKGVVGKVARYQGQQRVAIVIDGLLTVASAYVPSAFIEPIADDKGMYE